MAVININKDNFKEEILDYKGTVLVDFWAEWCGPCKMLSPVVDAVSEEVYDIKVCKINIDEEGELAIQYKVISIPTLVIFKDGEEVNRTVGVVPKSAILDMIKA